MCVWLNGFVSRITKETYVYIHTHICVRVCICSSAQRSTLDMLHLLPEGAEKKNTWGRGRGFTEGTTKHKVLKLPSCPFLGFELLMLDGKHRWRTKEKRKKGGWEGTKTEALSADWSSGFDPADFLLVQTVMVVAVVCGDFSARGQEDDEGGRCIERGRRQSTPAVFHLALFALLPRPWPGFERSQIL